jgi:UDP-glucose 4-epimerase
VSAVLVSGATTPSGRALVRTLLDEGRTVLAVAAEERWPFERHEALHYQRVDLTRARRIRELLFGPARDLGVSGIIHSAHHRRTTDRDSWVRALNVESTREMLHLAERHPTIERFVYRSYADVYRISPELPQLISEDHPLELGAWLPPVIRDRVEADLMVCTRMGMSSLSIIVLRCAEVFAPDCGSQLHDYLSSRVCLRPMGFDPMLDVLSLEDAAIAQHLAVDSKAEGVFNIPGMDVLPLSAAIGAFGKREIVLPGPLLGPLYNLRAFTSGFEFSYRPNRFRFHFSGVLDGSRAEAVLGYVPRHAIVWPVPTYVTHPPPPLNEKAPS